MESSFEKLGVFYLGKSKANDDLLLYDSKDLVTHAVCVGMTGSGKTGLCINLLEEAAIDGIPAIIIDPKGDLCDLLLTFPNLAPEDFAPWVEEGVDAAQQAQLWKDGLTQWGEDGERIKRLKDAADFRIYTPGSNAGLPVSILKSFVAPPETIRQDNEALSERINTTVTSLLALIGIDADPVRSREHILLSNILNHEWSAGRDLDIAGLIHKVQTPPITKVGVMELDSYFPADARFELAMSLNHLLASPSFASWMEGESLDVAKFLHTEAGKPRHSIFSIAHLSDPERMFFVSLLLNQVLGWMRTQSGTTSLRAILYMDEIFGYFPPVANPPSKLPLLTLLKQGRAFGLGVVLATQNPVDLDYKGLANTGTWFIGRLQTERDKARVLEGLEGIAAGTGQKFDSQAMEQLLAGLDRRIFLLNNVHDDAPEIFETRWALSYLWTTDARADQAVDGSSKSDGRSDACCNSFCACAGCECAAEKRARDTAAGRKPVLHSCSLIRRRGGNADVSSNAARNGGSSLQQFEDSRDDAAVEFAGGVCGRTSGSRLEPGHGDRSACRGSRI